MTVERRFHSGRPRRLAGVAGAQYRRRRLAARNVALRVWERKRRKVALTVSSVSLYGGCANASA